ncbi:hypothetical protein [Bradyrhizobium sp. CCBAU 051011]|nr:hypothetical protein [Bradyrhizobium sp. CCBAU 051011]
MLREPVERGRAKNELRVRHHCRDQPMKQAEREIVDMRAPDLACR